MPGLFKFFEVDKNNEKIYLDGIVELEESVYQGMIDQGKVCFGDIVVVEEDLIGVVVKSWVHSTENGKEFEYEVYVRNYNFIQQYKEKEIQRYMVRHKYLNEEEMEYQKTCKKDLQFISRFSNVCAFYNC